MTDKLTWENDPERQTVIVKTVREMDKGYEIIRSDGFWMWLDKKYGVAPVEGREITTYGKGIGYPSRGVVVDGKLAYYRTPEEEKAYQLRERFGADAQEWLSRWDRGDTVWTVVLGGLGPSYDQCINIAVAEVVRALLVMKPTLEAGALSKDDGARLEEALLETLKEVGLSGAQFGGARGFGFQLYAQGPMKAIQLYPEDRHTMASKVWPVLGLSKEDFERIADIIETNDLITVQDDERIAKRMREIAQTGG
jgi:hypothetical protein